MRQGLLPAPQKTASGRSLFTEDHERLLRKIIELKERNLPLAEVRSRLDQDLAVFSADKRDLEAQETEHMRATILRVATEEFVAHGYRGAHVDTIIRKLGINAHTFYSYFPEQARPSRGVSQHPPGLESRAGATPGHGYGRPG